jgi:hypothetical protein
MSISKRLHHELGRLGARVVGESPVSTAHVLSHHVDWPVGEFCQTKERIRAVLIDRGYDEKDLDSLAGDFRIVYNLRFPAQRGEFWAGWQDQFKKLDPATFLPFAADDYYFYFVTDNADDPSEPLLFSVDHEDTSEAPYGMGGIFVSEMLATLVAGESLPGCLDW